MPSVGMRMDLSVACLPDLVLVARPPLGRGRQVRGVDAVATGVGLGHNSTTARHGVRPLPSPAYDAAETLNPTRPSYNRVLALVASTTT